MEFGWTEEQQQFRASVVEFGRRALGDDVIARDRAGTFSTDLWRRCAEFGIQGLPFPERYGGSEMDILSTILAMEALGYTCTDNGLLFALAAQMWSVQMPIHRHGTEAQKERFLTPLCTGKTVGAHGMSEPDAGSDAFALRTTARREGDGFVLNGTKTFVSEAPIADLFVIFATTDPSRGVLGITAFLVERSTPGLTVGQHLEKMGLRTSPMAQVILEECRVPATNVLGREGRGAQLFNDSMEWERGCILASYLGTMERELETGIRYAKDRRQFGHQISDFQAVAGRLVDMKVRLETSRLLLYRAAWSKDLRGQAPVEAAMAKLFVSEAIRASSLDAVQIRGGYGYMVEYEAERMVRDAIGGSLYSGTSEIQRNLIARSLGL